MLALTSAVFIGKEMKDKLKLYDEYGRCYEIPDLGWAPCDCTVDKDYHAHLDYESIKDLIRRAISEK